MTQPELIEEHRAAIARFFSAPDGTVQHVQAEAALVASFARLNDRLSEAEEDSMFLRRQAL